MGVSATEMDYGVVDSQAVAKTTSEFRSKPVMNAASAAAPSRVGYARRPFGISGKAFSSFVDVTV